MSRTQRDLAVRVFMSRDKAPVMLMSQKCGGVGELLCRSQRVCLTSRLRSQPRPCQQRHIPRPWMVRGYGGPGL